MNKIVIIAFFIFWVAVSFFYAHNLVNDKTSNLAAAPVNNTDSQSDVAGTLAAELPKHNTKNDCWLAIEGKVYDVTNYIDSHPSGINDIVRHCGQEATEAFASKDKRIPKDHSQRAYDMLADYYVGDLTAVVTPENTTDNVNNTTNDNNTAANNMPSPVNYVLTKALVAEHNTAGDCWATAGNNVYNFTSYINSHPGGAANIINYCGTDIAAAFASIGHSNNASNIMASYQIGTLGSTVDNTAVEAVNSNPTNTGGGYDDDDDDEWDD